MKRSENFEFIYTQKAHYNFRHAVYIHTVSHTIWYTNIQYWFDTIFSQQSLIWVFQSALHILLLKQIVAIFWVPPLDSLDKISPYQQTLRTVWWRQRALTWAWILLRGTSSESHRTRMHNVTIFPTPFRTVPSEVFKNGW